MALSPQVYAITFPGPPLVVSLEIVTDDLDRTNLIIILGMMQVSKRVPLEDPNVLNIVRGIYILSNVIIAGVYAYTQFLINKKKGTFFWRGCDAVSAAFAYVTRRLIGLLANFAQT